MARRGSLYSTFVGAIPLDVTEDEIKQLFSSCGLIEEMYIAPTAKSVGKYGFVRYNTPEETIKAVTDLHKYSIHGSRLIVDFASDTAERIEKYQESQRKELKIKTCGQIECKPKNQEGSSKTSKNSGKCGVDFFSVYVGNLHQDVTERELQDLFSGCGLIDRVFHRQNETFGFVHYSSPEDAVKAVQLMNGKTVRDKIILVDLDKTTARQLPKELLPPELEVINLRAATRETRLKYYSVYVGNMHPDVSKEEVKHIFSSCGIIHDLFTTAYEDTGKQYGFVRYSDAESAMKAVANLHNTKLKNHPIVVQYAEDTVDRIPKDNTSSQCTVKRENSCQERRSSASSTCTSRPKGRGIYRDLYSIYVGHIHPDVTKKEIKDLFSGCGHVYDLFINDSSSDYKYGFIRFSKIEEVKSAITHMNGWKMKDCPLVVDVAHDTLNHLRRGSKLKGTMPSVNHEYCFDEKLTVRSPEMEAVMNRSRLHEALSSVACKMCPMKASSQNFGRILEKVDRTKFLGKNFDWKQDLSQESSRSLQDLTDAIKKRTTELTAKTFMDKFTDVSKTVEKMMKNFKPCPRINTSKQAVSSFEGSNTTHSSINNLDNKQETNCLKTDDLLSLQAQPKRDSPSFKSEFTTSRSHSVISNSKLWQLFPSPCQPTEKDQENLTIFEVGSKLRKEMSEGHNLKQQEKSQLDLNSMQDDKFSDDKEISRELVFPRTKKNAYRPEEEEESWGDHTFSSIYPETDETWGTSSHASYVPDLFYKFVDRSNDSASSSSSETCSSAPESSGYSSIHENGDCDSTHLGEKQKSFREKCLKSKSSVNRCDIDPEGASDRYLKSRLLTISC